ncbi:MAG: hypothetical protein NTW21_21125 [Verrucomicrobia bacterium]|nr:hypothetical protein [Verrucomicrobiota bacterium]
MKSLCAAILGGWFLGLNAGATAITMVPIFEALSLHGTDGDEAISAIGEALQAAVMSRPMALTGAFPEVLVDAIRSPHLIPTNCPNYQAKEANLLVLCKVDISGEMTGQGLLVRFDVATLAIPPEVDLTSRQVLKLALMALRKTLEAYQVRQQEPLKVTVVVVGADEGKAALRELGVKFEVAPGPPAR